MSDDREELRRWAEKNFRKVQVIGDARRLRAEALADRAVRAVGETVEAHERTTPFARRFPLTVEQVAIGVGVFGVAFFVGRWLSRRRKAPALKSVPLTAAPKTLPAWCMT